MQKKYLALALSGLLATALTGCGSDSDSNYQPQVPSKPDTPTKPDDSKPDTPTKPDDSKPGSDTEDNVGDAADSFDLTKESSVVGQQYVRGSTSKFDKTPSTNDDLANTGNATVLGAETLQNKSMTNIVVAQYPDTTVTDASGKARTVKYLLGEKPKANPNLKDADSLQSNNDSALALNGGTLSPFVTVVKSIDDKFVSQGEEAKINSNNSKFSQTATNVGKGGNDVRIFGNLSSANTAATSNSARYLAKEVQGVKTAKAGTQAQFDYTPLKLNNVQYGRVTGNLEGLKSTDIAGQPYLQAKLADKNFNGNTDQTDIYFYRGIDETAISDMPKSGTYTYAGHALMYGIDNSYTGETSNGLSNSVAFGTNAEAMGNFVKATYNAGDKSVTGSVYNIWDTDVANKTEALKSVDLVTFNGKVIGNTIKGSADRTYSKGDDKAAFKGSFYGKNAAEMGGSFNSVTKGYGKSEWGGVFGAQKVIAPEQPKPDVFVPPINAVE